MKVTIKELNAFGNVLQSAGQVSLAKEVHNTVLRALDLGITEVNIKDEHTYDLIKKAEKYIAFLQIKRISL